MYDECGSSSATMPLIEPSSRRLRSTGSTYSFSIQTSTRPNCSTTRYGLSRSLPACAKWLSDTPSPPKTTAKSSAPKRLARELPINGRDLRRDLRPVSLIASDDTRPLVFLCLRSVGASHLHAPYWACLELFVAVWSKVLTFAHFVIDSARLWVIVRISLVSGDTAPTQRYTLGRPTPTKLPAA